MSGILFWMIFIQASIFFIGAGLVISWLIFEPRERALEVETEALPRVRRNRFSLTANPFNTLQEI